MDPVSLVDVAGISVSDSTTQEVIARSAQPATAGPRLIYALHVGGLEPLQEPLFRQALNEADLVYADGMAIVLLARLAGARSISRSSTTDIGMPIIQALGHRLGRSPRVALVGGRLPTANKASQVLRQLTDCEIVLVETGYFEDDTALLSRLRSAQPDIIFVGLGMPKEALWTYRNRRCLPSAVVLTCGGWFGFLSGEEPRAPRALGLAGMEWVYRLAHDFPRLRRRYAVGAWLTLRNVPQQISKGASLSPPPNRRGVR